MTNRAIAATPATGSPIPFAAAKAGLRVFLKVAPGAARNAVGAPVVEADGGARLKVSVTAPAEGGKANAAVVKLLAKEWRLPKSSFKISAGSGARRKTVFVHGATDALMDAIGSRLSHD
ncbi:MAG: DUF167 domain-containing protein [Alphaproteobacteria bacterium]